MRLPKAGDVADLLRLPSVLSVPGDVLLGAAASSDRQRPLELSGRSATSCCLYLAGMALNDYADREVDAAERPERPIPSGRATPEFAFKLASGLTAAGLGLALATGGWRLLGVAVTLAATVWAYDLAAKRTFLGPPTMAAARFFDVLMGARTLNRRSLLLAASVVGGHTFVVTLVSRKESRGGGPALALGALAGTAIVTVAARSVCGILGAAESNTSGWRRDLVLAAGLLGAYAASLGRVELDAVRDPSAARLQRVVGTGVLGIMPLEAGMLAASGAKARASGVFSGWWFARWLARRRSVT